MTVTLNGTSGITTPGLTNTGSSTLDTGTANGVAYLNGSKVLTTGSALTFDGTTLTSSVFANSRGVIQADNPIGTGFNIAGNTTTYFGTTTNTPIVFIQNYSEQMRLTSTGLGIGTSSPVAKLTLEGTGNLSSGISIRRSNAVTFRLGMFVGDGSGGYTADENYIASNNTDLHFLGGGSGTTEIMRLTSSGNLGLGVTPKTWFSQRSAIQFSATGAITGASAYYPYPVLYGNNYYYDSTDTLKYIASSGASAIATNAHANGSIKLYCADSGTAGAALTFTQVLGVQKSYSVALEGASSQIGTGITFPATQSASSDANTLDDYEEGTWTPTFGSTSGSFSSITYQNRQGYYTKVGNSVFISGQFYTSAISVGTASGSVTITGLPFTAGGTVWPVYLKADVRLFNGQTPRSGQIESTVMYLGYYTTLSGDTAFLQVSNLGTVGNANVIGFAGWYQI